MAPRFTRRSLTRAGLASLVVVPPVVRTAQAAPSIPAEPAPGAPGASLLLVVRVDGGRWYVSGRTAGAAFEGAGPVDDDARSVLSAQRVLADAFAELVAGTRAVGRGGPA